ncbi:MAG: RagB/SusD family nutrient uptake outer membrane protein [Gemmatimonadaceae bacterium]
MLLAATVVACDNLLEVDTPSRIPSATLERPENAVLLVRSAIGDFDCAFGSYVVLGGLIGEELIDATQTADRFPYDRRDHQPSDRRYAVNDCEGLGVYTPLNTARASADNVLDLLQNEWTDEQVEDRDAMIATAAAYAGYSLVLLSEGFCSAVVSGIDEGGNIVYGNEIDPNAVRSLALERFDIAITEGQAAGETDIVNMARVGRARALLGLGRLADARTAAALVPVNFQALSTASDISGRRQNRAWSQNNPGNRATSVGTPYRTLNDPRIPVQNTGQSSITGVPLWLQLKYDAAGDPIPIATYDEAQLIIAEADIQAGNLANATTIINTYRARGNQLPLVAPTAQQLRDALIDQRRRELFLESHHLGDVIRYNITLQPAAGMAYHGSGTYGNQKCLNLPNVERQNNPNI